MRASSLVLVLLVGCGPSDEEELNDRIARNDCGEQTECLIFDSEGDPLARACDLVCQGAHSCCDCLTSFDCGVPSHDQCVRNLERGATITTNGQCDGQGRCGAFCGFPE